MNRTEKQKTTMGQLLKSKHCIHELSYLKIKPTRQQKAAKKCQEKNDGNFTIVSFIYM